MGKPHRVYDPVLGDRSVRELAAVTDAELAEDIRSAATAALDCAESWRRSAAWPGRDVDRRTYAAVAAVREALAVLPVDPSPAALTAVVLPFLNAWWPTYPAAAAAVSEAVDRLRSAAMHRPVLVNSARGFVKSGLISEK